MTSDADYLVDEAGCWLWSGPLFRTGYGRTGQHGYAHRESYSQHVGPIPPKFQIDHLCRVRRCINPTHLEAVTQAENLRRQTAAITQCPYGHDYTPENTYTAPSGLGGRRCIKCMRERSRRVAVERKQRRHARPLKRHWGHALIRTSQGWDCKCGRSLGGTKRAAQAAMTAHRASLVVAS